MNDEYIIQAQKRIERTAILAARHRTSEAWEFLIGYIKEERDIIAKQLIALLEGRVPLTKKDLKLVNELQYQLQAIDRILDIDRIAQSTKIE